MEPVTAAHHHNFPAPHRNKDFCNLWNLFSIIVFPIGLARVTNYLVGKYIIPLGVVASLAMTVFIKYFGSCSRMNFPILMEMETDSYQVKQFTYKTRDNVKIDAVTIKQKKPCSVDKEKWIVMPLPNGVFYQNMLDTFMPRADHLKVNILSMNYRGVGPKGGPFPSCFEDLIEDVDAGVRGLLERGVRPENILCEGLSLGGAVALHVAAKYPNMPALIQNTFSSLGTEAGEFLSKIFTLFQSKEPLNPELTPLVNIFFSLPELAIYVTYYVIALLKNIFTCNMRESLSNIGILVKITLLDTLIIPIAIVALILQMAEGLLCRCIPQKFTPSFYVIKSIIYLNQSVTTKENSLAIKLSKSPLLRKLAKGLMRITDWETNGIDAYQKRTGKTLVTYSPQDEIIPWEASLAKTLQKTHPTAAIIDLGENSTHCDSLLEINLSAYVTYLYEAQIIEKNIYLNLLKSQTDQSEAVT